MMMLPDTILRNWVKQHFSDQRLAEVYAFNEDGKMDYVDPCACILGVTMADSLHTNFECLRSRDKKKHHFWKARALPGASLAEFAYLSLVPFTRWRMSRILRAEMRERDLTREQIRLSFISRMVPK